MERILVALFLSIACPASLFFLCWWIAAAIALYGLWPLPDSWIAVAGFAGLGVGTALDIIFVNKWTLRFYRAKTVFLILIYLFWSAIALAVLMGLPFLNIVLGVLAGLYVGRRHHYLQTAAADFARMARNAGLFTALITGVETLLIGLAALSEDFAAEMLTSLTDLSRSAVTGSAGIAIVILSVIILMIIQFWFTRRTAIFAFKLTIIVTQ
jgi:hypothetical protein